MKIDTTRLLNNKAKEPAKKEVLKSVFRKELSFPGLRFFGLTNMRSRFFTELSILLSSGMDLRYSFEVLLEDVAREADKKTYRSVYEEIVAGQSLHESIRKTGLFSVYDIQSVRIGEQSGTLIIVINELAGFYNKSVTQRKQIVSALTYPALVLATTLLSMLFMMRFVVPMFRDIFQRFQGDLPSATRFIIGVSESCGLYSGLLLISLTGIISLCWFLRNNLVFRSLTSRLILKIPLAGRITGLIYRVRFCQTLRLLQVSDVKLLDSIIMIRDMIGFYPYEHALNRVKDDIIAGKGLAESMQQFKIFDKRLIALTRVGEEVNKIGEVYEQLTLQYTQELDSGIKSLNSILEPILIIFVGGMVAFILISMYLPIFQTGLIAS